MSQPGPSGQAQCFYVDLPAASGPHALHVPSSFLLCFSKHRAGPPAWSPSELPFTCSQHFWEIHQPRTISFCVPEPLRPLVPWGACVCWYLISQFNHTMLARQLGLITPYLGADMKLDGSHMTKEICFRYRVLCSPGWHRTCYELRITLNIWSSYAHIPSAGIKAQVPISDFR